MQEHSKSCSGEDHEEGRYLGGPRDSLKVIQNNLFSMGWLFILLPNIASYEMFTFCTWRRCK